MLAPASGNTQRKRAATSKAEARKPDVSSNKHEPRKFASEKLSFEEFEARKEKEKGSKLLWLLGEWKRHSTLRQSAQRGRSSC